MAKYQYLGYSERIYMDIVIPGQGSLVVQPGQLMEFETGPPGDGFWTLFREPKAIIKAPVKQETEGK